MSDFTTFLADIREWSLHPEYGDSLVSSFVRMAETTLDLSLRVGEMIVVGEILPVVNGTATLPSGYLMADFVTRSDGVVMEHVTPESFNNTDDTTKFTIRGNTMFVNWGFDTESGQQDPVSVSLDYFATIPRFSSDSTWLHAKYYNMFLQACSAAAALYGQEFERASALQGAVESFVTSANDAYKSSKRSGSTLKIGKPKRK